MSEISSIDEAIAHAREKAKEIRENIIDGDNLEPYESYCNAMVAKSSEEQEQLAEWLEELKTIKEMDLSIPQYFTKEQSDWIKAYCIKRNMEFYNKAIDDFAKWLENKKYLMKEIQERDFCYTHYDELKANCVTTEYFEEQLKVGDKNAD